MTSHVADSGFIRHVLLLLILICWNYGSCQDNTTDNSATIDRIKLRDKAKELFMFGYDNYMKIAFPHDELMPISCLPRIRGVTPSRGDVDDALGNFSLTLIDSLDTLVVVGAYDEFESATRKVIDTVRFDSNLIVSVFETNIRVVGGLISAHIMAKMLQTTQPPRMDWYTNELLDMAVDLTDRLLPAFNTTSGLPHPRVNLKKGMSKFLKDQVDTCTACGGTMILEMAALSRLTGKKIYEEKAKKAMDFLWTQRNHGSDLVGTVLNVENGNWIRREAGIGAGIDSYVEYSLKAYILLGEEDYLYRFNKHYDAIMRYVNKGPMFIDVHMHKPNVASRPYMDSLLAFWPGLQVLKGDLRSAIEIHEMLYQVVQKYKFLPEAFTHDFQIHWAQHPIRPEFVESTYLLYRATRDPHYLHVAAQVLDSIEKYTKVKCGFAGIKDLRSMDHEDRMDSFVLAETFKYLYLIFADPADLAFDPDNYVLTTEAHFLPLTIGETKLDANQLPRRVVIDPNEIIGEETIRKYTSACPSVALQFKTAAELTIFGTNIREAVQKMLNSVSSGGDETCTKTAERLKAWAFSSTNAQHLLQLKMMGIEVEMDKSGRVMLTHQPGTAKSFESQQWGLEFMKEMMAFNKKLEDELFNMARIERIVQIVSAPFFGSEEFMASPAQFGEDLNSTEVYGEVDSAVPTHGCSKLRYDYSGKILLLTRGDCMFQEKAKHAQDAGAIGVIIVDNNEDSSIHTSPLFTMSGDPAVEDVVTIPVVFLFSKEASDLEDKLLYRGGYVRLGRNPLNPRIIMKDFLSGSRTYQGMDNGWSENKIFKLSPKRDEVKFIFSVKDSHGRRDAGEEAKIVEDTVELYNGYVSFLSPKSRLSFLEIIRKFAYWILGDDLDMNAEDLVLLNGLIQKVRVIPDYIANSNEKQQQLFDSLNNDRVMTTVSCEFNEDKLSCKKH